MVYFMQGAVGGAIKIGQSVDVEGRRDQLSAAYGQELVILATMDGGFAEEQEIHRRFSHLRIGRKEQFQPAAELLAFIGRPLLAAANPEAAEPMQSGWLPTALTIKGSRLWRAWVEGLAKHRRTDVAKVVDAALTEYAEKYGYTEKPPER